jgi:hypothetical protein
VLGSDPHQLAVADVRFGDVVDVHHGAMVALT